MLVSKSSVVPLKFLVVFSSIYSALSEQMDWGYNADLVEEADIIQGREHIKLLVLLERDSLDLECLVAFTSNPVSEIRWTVDGKGINNTDDATVVIRNGEVFVEEHLRIDNVTAEMDGSTVACNYSKGQYGASVEAVFRVFKMEIELPEDICDTCDGDVKLLFRGSNRTSPAELNVDKRIKDKIQAVTKAQEIQVDNSGYSISVHLTSEVSVRYGITCLCRTEYRDVKGKPLHNTNSHLHITNSHLNNTNSHLHNTNSHLHNTISHPGICLAVALTIVATFVICGILVKKCLRWKRENDYWRGFSIREEEIGGYMKLRQRNGAHTVYLVI